MVNKTCEHKKWLNGAKCSNEAEYMAVYEGFSQNVCLYCLQESKTMANFVRYFPINFKMSGSCSVCKDVTIHNMKIVDNAYIGECGKCGNESVYYVK
jgi:hypothetical protein